MKAFKDKIYILKEWIKKMWIYPQNEIIPGRHFDYDSYWKEKRGDKNMGNLGRWQKKRAILASKIISQNNGSSINDIGSGAGEVLNFIKEHTKIKYAAAYDSSRYALEVAEKFDLKTVQMDINKKEDYALVKEADYSILFEILEHLPGPEELLKECVKKSQKGVLFSFPNTGFIIHRFRLFFFGKFPLQWAKHPGEHLRFWTKKDLVWWLRAQGYKNYKIYNYAGVPILKDLWPNLFCAGLLVCLFK